MSKDARIYCTQGPETLAPTAQGMLSGTQFVFKDLFDVAGYTTGAGNPAWLQSHAAASVTSPLISALLEEGAQCVGRVQTDELAYSLNGQNIHYGTPVNPKAPDCIPGGSSSGSAVAVANGDCDFAIGTDTGGSVRVPASYCGLFGLRPTLGALDLSHCFQLAESFDTAGIFSRDLALLKQVWSALTKQDTAAECASILYLDAQCRMLMSAERLAGLQCRCQQAGVVIREGDFLAGHGWNLNELSLLFRTIQGFEIIRLHNAWLSCHGDSLDPAILLRVEWAKTITPAQYEQAKAQQQIWQQQLTAHLEQVGGLWVMPTTPAGPPSLSMPADQLATYRSQLMGLTSIAGLAGCPQLHLPMDELLQGPCGFSLMGLPHQEPVLLATGAALDSVTLQGEQ